MSGSYRAKEPIITKTPGPQEYMLPRWPPILKPKEVKYHSVDFINKSHIMPDAGTYTPYKSIEDHLEKLKEYGLRRKTHENRIYLSQQIYHGAQNPGPGQYNPHVEVKHNRHHWDHINNRKFYNQKHQHDEEMKRKRLG